MHRLLLAILSAACLSGCIQAPVRSEPADILDEQLLLVLTSEAPEDLIVSAQQQGYTLVRTDRLEQLGDVLVHLKIPEDRSIPEAIAEIEELVPGVTAGANHVYRLQAIPTGQDFARQLIGWPGVGCRAQQPIGLIDAGVATNHPALASGHVVQEVFHGAPEGPSTDHGTLMAELLIGDGRLTDATLYSASSVAPSGALGGVASVDAILRSVNWLRTVDVGLVNISLAGPFNKLLNRGLGRAAEDGMIFVAAVGNAGPEAAPQYPAAFPFVIAVTAVDRDLSAFRLAVRGDHIDLSAPGVDILVHTAGRLRVMSGTSAAAPYVTAVIAADQALIAASSVQAVRQRLRLMALDLGPPGEDRVFGAGPVQTPPGCG